MLKQIKNLPSTLVYFSGYLLAGSPSGVNSDLFNSVGSKFAGTGNQAVPSGANDLGDILLFTVNLLLVVVATIAVIFLMLGGYRYIMARGNEEEAEAAKKTISNAILGLILVILAFVIVRIVIRILTEGQGAIGI